MSQPLKVRIMTLRLPWEQANELELVASIDGMPMSEEIREALEQHVKSRREDPEFQARLKRNQDRLNQLSSEQLAASCRLCQHSPDSPPNRS